MNTGKLPALLASGSSKVGLMGSVLQRSCGPKSVALLSPWVGDQKVVWVSLVWKSVFPLAKDWRSSVIPRFGSSRPVWSVRQGRTKWSCGHHAGPSSSSLNLVLNWLNPFFMMVNKAVFWEGSIPLHFRCLWCPPDLIPCFPVEKNRHFVHKIQPTYSWDLLEPELDYESAHFTCRPVRKFRRHLAAFGQIIFAPRLPFLERDVGISYHGLNHELHGAETVPSTA